jgi:hypothetical protein
MEIYSFPLVMSVDSLSLVERKIPRSIKPISTIKDLVIEPVNADLKLSIQKINTIPEICPISISKPFDVPSEAGKVISAPYWNPIGPALSRKNPNTVPEKSRSQ